MSHNDYHFVSRWRVQSTIQEVSEILSNALDLPRWWPAVYLDVQQLEPGDEQGLDQVFSLHTKGWLPYTLRWQFRVTENRWPHGFSLQAWGDFVGQGVWALAQAGDWVNITYDWRIKADKPLLRTLSFILKPIFSANHRWAMRQGEKSLRLEVARRRAADPAAVPPPPGPTRPTPQLLLASATLATLLFSLCLLKRPQ